MKMKIAITGTGSFGMFLRPDEFIPNSFRLLREFVMTMDDMPVGTMESILANRYG